MFRNLRWILVILLMFSLAGFLNAQSADDEGLSNKVTKLEKELNEVKEQVKNSTPKLSDEDLQSLCNMLERDTKWRGDGGYPVKSSVDIEIYGYLKLDAAYDTQRTDVGDFARWVEHSSGRGHDDQYNMTARQTRLGLKFKGPASDNIITTGKVEIDFYGETSENKPNPMMRHAYLQIEWPVEQFSIIAGQTWDLISPLNPRTVNYAVQWWAGNIGYRRPQIRLTKVMPVNDDIDFKMQAGIFRTIGHDSGAFDPGDTGEDAGFPCTQARASITLPLLDNKKATFGVSGHYAQEEYDYSFSDHNEDAASWSYNFDLDLPIMDGVTGKGEWYRGKNMDAYLGGIGQGVNVAGAGPTTKLTELNCRGGWFAFFLGPWDNFSYTIGASSDHVSGVQATAGQRTRNSSGFVNAWYSINKKTQVAFEIARWRTAYDGPINDGDDLRLQMAFIYNF